MSRPSLRLGPLPLLALLSLLLAAALTWMWFDEHAKPRNLSWAAPKPLAPDIKVPVNPGQGAAAAAKPDTFAVILERPLFAPDRRPPPPPAPTPPPDPFANIQISGIFSGANAGILASVDGKTRRVKINETVGAWTLKSIDGRNITFTQGAESRQLRLAYARIDTPAPKPTPVPTAMGGPPGPQPAPAAGAPQNGQDEMRDRLRRRNELRATRGLPPITE